MKSTERTYQWLRRGYSLLYLPLAPAILMYWATRQDSRTRWREYLGGGATADPDRGAPAGGTSPSGGASALRVWVHAVSVGEVLSAVPILEALEGARGPLRVVLTTTIQDALDIAAARGLRLSDRRFLPLDVLGVMERLLERFRPDMTLVSETDLWPNMLEAHHRKGIPIFLVNGRISYKIHRGYRLLGGFARTMLGRFTRAFVQTELDRERLVDLGMDPVSIDRTGNTKYEASLGGVDRGPDDPVLDLLRSGPGPTLVGGSTHPGEEEPLLDLVARRRVPGLRLVLAPRILRRTGTILDLARARGLLARAVSTLDPGRTRAGDAEVLVVDRLGLLARIYALADLAFVGGSFDGSGGHNFLEAAGARCPFVVGPRMRNFHEDVDRFSRAGALVQVGTPGELVEALEGLLARPDERRELGRRARELLESHQGAAARTATGLLAALESAGRGRS